MMCSKCMSVLSSCFVLFVAVGCSGPSGTGTEWTLNGKMTPTEIGLTLRSSPLSPLPLFGENLGPSPFSSRLVTE